MNVASSTSTTPFLENIPLLNCTLFAVVNVALVLFIGCFLIVTVADPLLLIPLDSSAFIAKFEPSDFISVPATPSIPLDLYAPIVNVPPLAVTVVWFTIALDSVAEAVIVKLV